MKTLLLGVMLTLLLAQTGCGTLGKPDQLLEHKIECAQQAREYWKVSGDYWGAGDHPVSAYVKVHTEWYTYSPRLNTCILYEHQFVGGDNTPRRYFIDILTGREIQGLGLDELALFREVNVDTDEMSEPKR